MARKQVTLAGEPSSNTLEWGWFLTEANGETPLQLYQHIQVKTSFESFLSTSNKFGQRVPVHMHLCIKSNQELS